MSQCIFIEINNDKQIQPHKVIAHAPHCEYGTWNQLKERLGTRLPKDLGMRIPGVTC